MTSNAFLKCRKMQTNFRPSSIAKFQESTTSSNATVVEENDKISSNYVWKGQEKSSANL